MDILEIVYKKMNKGLAALSLLIGVFCSLGMSLALRKTVTSDNSPEIDLENELMVTIRALYRSTPGGRLKSFLAAICLAILIYVAIKSNLKMIERILIFAYSVIFAVLQLVTLTYKKVGNWDLIHGYPLSELRAGIRGVSMTIVCMAVVTVIYAIAKANYFSKEKVSNQKVNVITVVAVAAVIFVSWLPYFFIFYPGTSNEDTVIQMMEYFSIPSYIQKMSPIQGDDIFFTNHHPYSLTMLFGVFFDLGLKMGDINKGIAVYTILHMIFLSFVFSAAINYLRYIGVTLKRQVASLCLFMFLPIFPLYSVCMVKDTLFSGFALLMTLMMIEVARTKGQILDKWWFLVLIIVDAAGMLFTKGYGMHILIVIGVVYLCRYWRKWYKIAIAFLVPVILFKCVYINVLLPSWNVAPGGIQEALSVPFQQTARYVTELPDEVTKSEKKAISAILPYKKLSKLYNPELSDPVKKRYNQEATTEELREYFKVWYKMGKKHPGLYLQSILNNTYQYYDINKTSNLEYYKFNDYLIKHDKKGEYEYLYVEPAEETLEARYVVQQLVLFTEKIPILNIFTSLGLLPWIFLFLFIYNLLQKKHDYNIALLVQYLTICICMVSPDNGNSRYVMPLFFVLPFIFHIIFIKECDIIQEPKQMSE